MIVTLTLNPGLDLTYTLTESSVGEVDVHRAATATLEASGKGVNVSRALHTNRIETVAVVPVGGSTGHHLAELLDLDGVRHRTITQSAATRVNTTMALSGGHTAKVNGPGGRLTDEDVNGLTRETAAALADADGDEVWLAVCGSLPPGLGPAVIGDFVALAHAHGARCAVDASGPALAVALAAGADLLAPNRLELAEIDADAAGAHTVEELSHAASDIARHARTSLLVSLGEDGALFTDGEVVLHGRGPTLTPVNTAGAGDALLSGWLAESGALSDRMARAIRWSRAACLSPTTVAPLLPQPDPTDGVSVDRLPTRRPERSPS